MSNILKFFGSNLKISGPCNSVPLEWFRPIPPTYSKTLLRVVKDDKSKKSLRDKSYFATATIVLLLIQGFYESINSPYEDFKRVIIPWMLIIISIAGIFYLYVCKTKAAEIAELVNAFIQFDKMYPRVAKRFCELPVGQILGLAMTTAIFFSQIVVPIGAVFGFHLIDPYKPSLEGYWLIHESDNQSERSIFTKCISIVIATFLLIYNYRIWNFFVAPLVLVSGVLYNLCTIALLDCIDL